MDGFYNVSLISIARSGSYLHELSPKDVVLHEVITGYLLFRTLLIQYFLETSPMARVTMLEHISLRISLSKL